MVLQGEGLQLLGFRACVLPQKRVHPKDDRPCDRWLCEFHVKFFGGGSRAQALLNPKP